MDFLVLAARVRATVGHYDGFTDLARGASQCPAISGFGFPAAGIEDQSGCLICDPADDCIAICREGMKSFVEVFRCSTSQSTTGPRWKADLPTQSARVDRRKSMLTRANI